MSIASCQFAFQKEIKELELRHFFESIFIGEAMTNGVVGGTVCPNSRV